MKLVRTAEYDTDFREDISDIFQLFSIPRFEFQGRGENLGFFDTTNSKSMNNIMLHNLKTNLLYLVHKHFENVDEIEEVLEKKLRTHTHKDAKEFTITFYTKSRQPIGIEITDGFEEGEKIATISRDFTDDVRYDEPDIEMFDWLYSIDVQHKTNIHGELDCGVSLSIRITDDYVDYSASSGDYDKEIRKIHNEQESKNIIQKMM